MKVLIDTRIWLIVLCYKSPNMNLTKKLKDLISDGRVCMTGPVRQELLSGISDKKQFNQLKELLLPFEDIQLKTSHFEKAAELSNIWRVKMPKNLKAKPLD